MPLSGMPKMIGGGAIRPVNVSTGGIHPLVKKSMLPRMKMNRAQGVKAQSTMMAKMQKPIIGGGANMLDRNQRKSRRGMVGRKPLA